MNPLSDLYPKLLLSSDLNNVAILHQKAFKNSTLTKFGVESIKRYYAWQLFGPHNCYAVGVFNKNDSLLGFCFAGVFQNSLSGFLLKNKRFLFSRAITHPWLIINPQLIGQIKNIFRIFKKTKITNTNASTSNNNSFGILSIAVDPERNGSGIGTIIMNLVEEKAIKQGYSQMHLTVHPNNGRAIAFYEKCGWKKSTNAKEKWTGYMIKSLCSK